MFSPGSRSSVGIADLRKAIADYANAFDPALITAAEADRVVSEASAIANMANTICALAAARVASTSLWRSSGDRSAAHRLARTTGSSVGTALATIETGRRLDSVPGVAAAARRGELSVAQSAAITQVAAADPATEGALLATAAASSLSELQSACAQVRANTQNNSEYRRRRIHQGRYLRSYTDAEGAWNLHMRDNPEVGAQIMATLAPIRDQMFAQARSEGRRESTEAYAADALRVLATESLAPAETKARNAGPIKARSSLRRNAAAKIIARVDLAALLRGYPESDEVCELVGVGPVAVSAVRDFMETADPFLAAVVTKGVDVVGVAHLGRRPNAHQQTALEWLYPTCAVEGCSATVRLETDHRLDWADSHFTVLELLDRLCSHHHDLKTYQGWSLVPGKGKRRFVGPEDPRHPAGMGPRASDST